MTRHPLDPVSLVFGLFFTGAGLSVLLAGSDAGPWDLDFRWIWPAVLILAGALMMASLRRPPAEGPDEPDEPDDLRAAPGP